MILPNVAIYDLARGAGFAPDVAVQMVAIALRESGGDPAAVNLKPPDESYGLWQINMYDSPPGNRAARFQLFGITDARQLLDPATNAAAAFRLYAGNPRNLEIAWAINRTGPPYYYAEKYQRYLAPALLARQQSSFDAPLVAGAVGGGGPGPDFPSGQAAAPAVRPVTGAPSAGGISSRMLPSWFTAWWRARFSRSLPADSGLTDALLALAAIYGREKVAATAAHVLKPPGSVPADPHGTSS